MLVGSRALGGTHLSRATRQCSVLLPHHTTAVEGSFGHANQKAIRPTTFPIHPIRLSAHAFGTKAACWPFAPRPGWAHLLQPVHECKRSWGGTREIPFRDHKLVCETPGTLSPAAYAVCPLGCCTWCDFWFRSRIVKDLGFLSPAHCNEDCWGGHYPPKLRRCACSPVLLEAQCTFMSTRNDSREEAN